MLWAQGDVRNGRHAVLNKSDDEIVMMVCIMPETCALDVTERGQDHTLEAAAGMMSLSRERVRQIEDKSQRKLRMRFPGLKRDLRFLERSRAQYGEAGHE
jgi:DNA-directed RNA polymerase sigma subunit (sigma70/sigma32)